MMQSQSCEEGSTMKVVARDRRTLAFAAATLLLVAAAALAFQSLPPLPKPFETPSANNRPQVIPQPDGAQIKVPTGFNVDVFADGFEVPRYMLLLPGNVILMTDSAQDGKGAVYAIRDTNSDNKA